MKPFVHLHVHTEFSLLDGVARINKLVEMTKERGWNAVAITDHGNMYGTLMFYEECIKNNIKPILGCEFYICHDLHSRNNKDDTGHIILLAKNDEGFHNLLKLNEIAFCEGYYYKPRIDYDTLEKYSKGIICLSACLAGHIPRYIMQRNYDEAEKLALRLKNMFDDGDFYLEIQNHGIEEQKEVLLYLDKLSKKIGVKLVATNDVHYLNKEDAEMQDVLMCVQMGKTLDDPDRMKFQTQEFYYKTYEEMAEAFRGFEEALDVPNEIADKCEVVIKTKSLGEIYEVDEKYKLPQSKNYIPVYRPDTGETPYEFLRRISYEGLHNNYKEITQEHIDRLEEELTIIHEQGFVEYFLIVWDYINEAKKMGIPVGPGRGSGAGSLVAYCSGITRVDPIKYHLFFERFINKERVSMPDFDVDFCMDRRGEVIEYVKRRYGEDHVACIVTFGCMQAKNAIRDVARVLRMPYSDVDKITKAIPAKLPDGIKRPPVLKYYFGTTGKPENDKYIIPELREMYDNDEFVKKIADMAIKLEGVPRNTSQHACGVLIAPEPVANFVPVAKSEDERVTQYIMTELEHMGLLKMDFLGLRTLTDIKKALDYIEEDHGVKIDFYDMEYDDKNVFELISSGKTDAVFQLESAGMKKFMKDLKPDCMDDIIAGISMYRPGPMDAIPKFVQNKKHPESVVYDDPCLEDILDVTYGCIVYQEQVMKIVQVMGGYSLGQADNIRRIMGKKQVEKIDQEREKFVNGWQDPAGKKSIPGAVKLGHNREVAEKIFDEMKEFAKYAFNKSHAAAYAYISYQTAYLKCYYEVEFLTSVLNNRISNADDVKKYTAFAKSEGIDVLNPDVNKSYTNFKVENGAIRFGLGALKHVGTAVMDTLVNERKQNGEFKSLDDLIERLSDAGVNKKCFEMLILSGACDCFGKTRSQLMAVYSLILDKANKDRKTRSTGQFSLFDTVELKEEKVNTIDYPDIKEFNRDYILKQEKEVVGMYVSGHPLDDYLDKYQDLTLTSNMIAKSDDEDEMSEEVEEDDDSKFNEQLQDGQVVTCGGIINSVKKLKTKSGNKDMAFFNIEDIYGNIEVAVFPNNFSRFKNLIVDDQMATIKGKISIKGEGGISVICDTIIPWKKVEEKVEEKTIDKKIYLRFDTQDISVYQAIKGIIASYPGNSQVIIKCTSTNQAFIFNSKVDANNYLINEITGLIGSENIVVQEG